MKTMSMDMPKFKSKAKSLKKVASAPGRKKARSQKAAFKKGKVERVFY